MAQRLYSSSGDKLYPAVMATINGLVEVKLQLINGDAYKGIYEGNWLNEDSKGIPNTRGSCSPRYLGGVRKVRVFLWRALSMLGIY